jgi:hypothetical protein
MKRFYQLNPAEQICQTLSDKFNRQGLTAFFQMVSEKLLLPAKCQTASGKSSNAPISQTTSAELKNCGSTPHKSAEAGKLQTLSAKSANLEL